MDHIATADVSACIRPPESQIIVSARLIKVCGREGTAEVGSQLKVQMHEAAFVISLLIW